MSREEYEAAFGIGSDPKRTEAAHANATDVHKFESQLGWNRIALYWTFLGAACAGYGAIQTVNSVSVRTDLSVMLSSLGLVFTFAWHCINRGTEHWQESWENHVAQLEDAVTGPLHKVVLHRPRPAAGERITRLLVGPAPFSASKIGQLLSIYMLAMWLVLLIHALPPISRRAPVSPLYATCVGLVVIACMLIVIFGRSQAYDYEVEATIRGAKL